LNILGLWVEKDIPKSQVNAAPNQRINADGKNVGGAEKRQVRRPAGYAKRYAQTTKNNQNNHH